MAGALRCPYYLASRRFRHQSSSLSRERFGGDGPPVKPAPVLVLQRTTDQFHQLFVPSTDYSPLGSAYQFAEVYAFGGQPDKAFEWLERAFAQHNGGMSDVRNDPFLRKLHGDPRFEAMLVKMKMAD